MKLGKKQLRAIAAAAALLIAYNVLAFAIPFHYTALFWVGYLFGLAALIIGMLIFALAFGENGTPKSRFYGFPVARVGALYIAVQLPLSFIAMALAGVERVPAWLFVLVFVVLFALAVLGTVATDMSRDEILRQEAALAANTAAMKGLRTTAASLVLSCTDPAAKQELMKLSDALKYSDPVSAPETEQAEAQLAGMLADIGSAAAQGDSGRAAALAESARALLAGRNEICRQSKHNK